jgi:hypothetical protein
MEEDLRRAPRKSTIAKLLAALVACTALPTSANTLATNLGPGNTFSNDGIIIENFFINGEVTGFATSFLPATTATLRDVVLPLSTDLGGSLTVGIASDADGQPGSVLTLLTQNGSISSATALVTFTCAYCPVLQAATRYWIVAVPTTGYTDATWHFSPSALGNAFFSNGQGNVGVVIGPWSTAGQTFPTPAFEVDGVPVAAVPALSDGGLALAGAFLAFLGAWIIRRGSKPNRSE